MFALRLDKFFVFVGKMTRSEASKTIRGGGVAVDGKKITDPATHIDPDRQIVSLCGQTVVYRKFTYIMMNKPKGVVCATEDGDRTVIDLLPEEERRRGLFPCGRLDKNTTGFVLVTDDGTLAHRLLSPNHHVAKVYRFLLKFPFSDDDIRTLESGVELDGFTTLPCEIKRLSDREGEITLREGKFHQIKRMFEYVHNRVRELTRISFASLPLDASLDLGKWRYLDENEISTLYKCADLQKS